MWERCAKLVNTTTLALHRSKILPFLKSKINFLRKKENLFVNVVHVDIVVGHHK